MAASGAKSPIDNAHGNDVDNAVAAAPALYSGDRSSNEHEHEASTRAGSLHGSDEKKRDLAAAPYDADGAGSLEAGKAAAGSTDGLIADKSAGVIEMESLKARIDLKTKMVIYGCLALLSYVLSMNQYTAGAYLNLAVSRTFGRHSLQATIGTVTSVFQAMAQPPIAKCADYFGRTRTYFGCVSFFALGYIIVASSNGIVTYAVGNSIYVIGITGLFFLQNVIVSDISSSRNRWWWTQFPNILQTINGFVAGDIVESLVGNDGRGNATRPWLWRWGYGMFIILVPVIAIPIILTMFTFSRPSPEIRAELKAVKAVNRQTPFLARLRRESTSFFWQLDFIGLYLFMVGFGLFFTTLTTANSRVARWSDANSIIQLVFGAEHIIAFVVWEKYYAPHPLLPFGLLRRKTVVGCILIALLSPMGGRIVGAYLFTFLQVAAGQSAKSATNITAYNGVAGTITGIIFSLVAARFRSIKWFITLGFAIQCLGTGLMIRYRMSDNSQAELAVVQVIRGIASGLLPYPTQALIQVASPHEHLAAITAGWLVVYYISGGIGSAIGGAIWTTVVPRKLASYVGPFGNESLVALAFNDPFGYAVEYPMGTPERTAIARAQDEAQRMMVIAGLVIAFVALLVSIFLLDNIRTTDDQSLPESEEIAHQEKQQEKKSKASTRVQHNPEQATQYVS